jgi:putative flavoprotein involved in K+ transport
MRRVGGTVDVLVIGAGHSGLAMSRALSLRSIDHLVIERGEVANSWRRERWDSLRLLTPNWMSRLPDYRYQGDDPDGYMAAGEVAEFVSQYATTIAAPVITGTTVTRVEPAAGGYRVATNHGEWRCRAVVLASGACTLPVVPKVAEGVPVSVSQVTTHAYRNPSQLEEGGVLVVGASATGLQLAQEIHASGRPVTLAVGEHVRMPRLYRGRDVQWWMLAAGVLDQCLEEMDDPLRARRLPSPQLVGTREHATLDLNVLREQGVEIVGRLMGVRDGRAQFSGSLRNVCALADLKMNRLLALFDEWAERTGVDVEVGPPERYAGTVPDTAPRSHDRLGDRLPAGFLLARRARLRSARTTEARRRRRGSPRHLCAGPALPATAQVELHARRRGRRARPRRAPRAASRSHSSAAGFGRRDVRGSSEAARFNAAARIGRVRLTPSRTRT